MKELQVSRAAATATHTYDDDDADEPPPLELENDSREALNDNQREEQPDASLMDEMVVVAERAKAETRWRQEKERNSRTFGHGLKKGFFNAKPRGSAGGGRSATAARESANERGKKMPTREDLLIVKQQPKDEEREKASSDSRFIFPEVQSALKGINQLDPKAWMNAKFFEKLAQNPRLALALQNPRFTQAIDEMQRDPEAAVSKYRNDAAVSAMLQDFLGFLGSHFEEMGKEQEAAVVDSKQQQQNDNQMSNRQEDIAALLVQKSQKPQKPQTQPGSASRPAATKIVDLDETRRAAIADMARSPEEDAQVQKILQSPELLQALSDADLMARLQRCRESPQELRRLQSDPSLARKLRLLADAGLVRFE